MSETRAEARERIRAEYVGDNHPNTELRVPDVMGTPKEGQLEGTKLERLAELAGRICYDSLGSGRVSADYHKHIQEVKHGSVLEHGNFTIEVMGHDVAADILPIVANRPGLWVSSAGSLSVRLTLNLRSLIEWDQWIPRLPYSLSMMDWLCRRLFEIGHEIAPAYVVLRRVPKARLLGVEACLTQPASDEECWVSLLLGGSRGMSHEQVRHGDQTAISQRSTRYVDENESAWIAHPLITAYHEAHEGERLGMASGGSESIEGGAQEAYRVAVEKLQAWLVSHGVSKFGARKQARGAARGYLGNALYTEMIFSASVAQWKRMLRQRCSDAADAEIRVLYGQVLPALKESAFAEAFEGMTLVPAGDGIGQVLEETA